MDLKKWTDRTSVRDFTSEKLTKEEIDQVVEVINNSPTSINAQQFSAIIITDNKILDFLSKYQPHIASVALFILFVADRSRTQHIINKTGVLDNELIRIGEYHRSIIDATIASTYAMDALHELGYGTTMIGGVTAVGEELSRLVNLPKSVFPVIGLSVGKASKTNAFKPKLDKVFFEKYDEIESIKRLESYNLIYAKYVKEIRGKDSDFFAEVKVQQDPSKPLGQGLALNGSYWKNKYESEKNE